MNNRFRAKKGATAITTYQRGLDSNSGSDDIYIWALSLLLVLAFLQEFPSVLKKLDFLKFRYGRGEEDTKKMEELLGDWFYRKIHCPSDNKSHAWFGKESKKSDLSQRLTSWACASMPLSLGPWALSCSSKQAVHNHQLKNCCPERFPKTNAVDKKDIWTTMFNLI